MRRRPDAIMLVQQGGELSSAPLRVCIIAPSTRMVGGQAEQAARLLDRLGSVPGISTRFVCIDPILPRAVRWTRRVRFLRTCVNVAAYCLDLARNVPQADVLHVFSASYWSFVLFPVPAMIAGRLLKKGVLLNYHSGEAEDHLTRWRRSIGPLLRLAHTLVVPSLYLVDVFARHGFSAAPIANFVDTHDLIYRHRRLPSPLFLSNRNLEPLYDVATTIRAFARVKAHVPEAKLVLAGDGSEREALVALVDSLRLSDVTFLGQVSRDTMRHLYNGADVYLNSSRVDNMPISILEAFASGLPVVSTAAGGIPYIAEDGRTALLVQPGDDVGMADAAIRMTTEPGLAERLADAAHSECIARYAWPVVASRWVATYTELLSPERRLMSANAVDASSRSPDVPRAS